MKKSVILNIVGAFITAPIVLFLSLLVGQIAMLGPAMKSISYDQIVSNLGEVDGISQQDLLQSFHSTGKLLEIPLMLTGLAIAIMVFVIVFKRNEFSLTIKRSIVLVISFVVISLGWLMLIPLMFKVNSQPNQELLNQMISSSKFTMFVSTVIIGPIMEEFAFRYFMLDKFSQLEFRLRGLRRTKLWNVHPDIVHSNTRDERLGGFSMVLVTLIFTLLHSPSGIIGFLTYLIPATGLMIVRYYSKSSITSTYAHSLWNALAFIL